MVENLHLYLIIEFKINNIILSLNNYTFKISRFQKILKIQISIILFNLQHSFIIKTPIIQLKLSKSQNKNFHQILKFQFSFQHFKILQGNL